MPWDDQMLMRVVRTLARAGKWPQFEREMFEKAPNMQGVAGALGSWVLRDLDRPEGGYVVELWESERHAADWKYAAVHNRLLREPRPGEFECHTCEIRSAWAAPGELVANNEGESGRSESRSPPLYVRLTEGRVHPGMWADFENAYKVHVETRAAPGLRMRWLVRSKSDAETFFTVSVWDTLDDMESFERSDAVRRQILKHIAPHLRGISSAHHCEVHKSLPFTVFVNVVELATMIRTSGNA
jgi:heme-degrading monooxygenase HmoA